MFVRLKTSDGQEANVNINTVKTFVPANNSANGSVVNFVDGSSIIVTDSCRSIRGYAKKAMMDQHSGGATIESEAAPTS